MKFPKIFASSEARSAPNAAMTASDAATWRDILDIGSKTFGVSVNEQSALGVSAIWQAVNLVSGTIADLPFHLYRDKQGTREKAKGDKLYRVIHDQANDVMTKFDFWRWAINRLLLDGRAIALLVKDRAGRVTSFVPLDRNNLEIEQQVQAGRLSRSYRHTPKDGRSITYDHTEVADFLLHPRGDGFTEYSPLKVNQNTIGLMIAAEQFAAQLLCDGGTPALTLSMPLASSPRAQEKGTNEISSFLSGARKSNRKVLPIPNGFELKPIGIDPQKQQLIELRQFQVAEAARIFNVPPALLHDLSNGSYSNFSQQAQNFAQMTIAPIVKCVEMELNSKLFGARNTANFVEFDLGGLLRGDLTTRTQAFVSAIQAGLLTPNEARAMENRPGIEGGDEAFIQGASITLKTAAKGGFTEQSAEAPTPISDETADSEPIE